jgi:hypothetical protein
MPYRTPPPGAPPRWYRLGFGFAAMVLAGYAAGYFVITLMERWISLAH